ncbi:MAG TPA: Uma2 family endonuclease [Thermoanaerobaculia bacterium]|jgi:Uma2 family endonuclease|nr:Uma2 family endonuclease [Thermoanaerobaculia bacterium]
MTADIRGRATYADLENVPELMIAELIDGDLYSSPRPSGLHARVSSVLSMDIGAPYDRGHGGPGGWWILFQPEIHFREHVLVPDLAGWRRERMPVIPADRFVVVPDWVCEVISPSSEAVDRAKKRRIYAECDVSWLWFVDPLVRLVEVFTLKTTWSLIATYTGEDVVRAEPFPAAEIDLGSIWGTDDE